MAYNESDDKLELRNEIRKLKEQVADLDKELGRISMTKKFLTHRIADMEYLLKTNDDI